MLSGMCHWRGGIAIDWSRFWQKYLGLMYSQATVRSCTRIELSCVGDHTLKKEGYKVDKKSTHRNTSCGNLRRPTSDKGLLLRVAAFLASADTGRRVRTFVERVRVRPTREPEVLSVRSKTQETDRVAFQAKCNELRLHAAGEERTNSVSFAIGNSWTDSPSR